METPDTLDETRAEDDPIEATWRGLPLQFATGVVLTRPMMQWLHAVVTRGRQLRGIAAIRVAAEEREREALAACDAMEAEAARWQSRCAKLAAEGREIEQWRQEAMEGWAAAEDKREREVREAGEAGARWQKLFEIERQSHVATNALYEASLDETEQLRDQLGRTSVLFAEAVEKADALTTRNDAQTEEIELLTQERDAAQADLGTRGAVITNLQGIIQNQMNSIATLQSEAGRLEQERVEWRRLNTNQAQTIQQYQAAERQWKIEQAEMVGQVAGAEKDAEEQEAVNRRQAAIIVELRTMVANQAQMIAASTDEDDRQREQIESLTQQLEMADAEAQQLEDRAEARFKLLASAEDVVVAARHFPRVTLGAADTTDAMFNYALPAWMVWGLDGALLKLQAATQRYADAAGFTSYGGDLARPARGAARWAPAEIAGLAPEVP